MSNRINRNKNTYQLRGLSSIINGEEIIPFNTYRAKSNRKENSKKIRNLSDGSKYSKKKKVNQRIILTNRGRGIDLNKVCGSSHPSSKNLNFFINKFPKKIEREEAKNDFMKDYMENDICNIQKNDDYEISERENYILNTYRQKPFPNNSVYSNYNINKNNEINYNSKTNEFLNSIGNNNDFIKSNIINNCKRNNIETYNNDQQNCNLKNILKKEYLLRNGKQLSNDSNCNYNYNCINEQQYQSSLPSNIPLNEIINNKSGESISITAIDNYVNKNKNNENKENHNLNDIYYRINEYQNKFNNTIRNNINCNDKYNNNLNISFNKFQNNKNIRYYYEDKNRNKSSINNNIIPTLINKENYYSNKNNINNNNDYLALKKYINNRNNDYGLKINKKMKSLNNNSFTTSNYYSETGANTSRPSKYFLKSVFDDTSTKDFMRTFSPKNSKQTFNEFNFNETYRPNKRLIEHNFFSIQKDEKRLDQLLKKIPRHNKEDYNKKFSNYSMYKLFKDRGEKIRNKRINSFLILTKKKNNNIDNDTVMPPNRIIYNNN